MLPDGHRQEAISRAFITAIAAKAGVKCAISGEQDLGIDGFFKLVRPLETLRPRRQTSANRISTTPTNIVKIREYGLPLEFQLKSSINCNIREADVKYQAHPDDYDKLVDPDRATPILLIVCALPDEQDWLEVLDDHTKLGGRCFYYFPTGLLTTNSDSITITIPRTNLLTELSLKTLLTNYHNQYQIVNSSTGSNVQSN